MTEPQANLVNSFYSAMQRRDVETMCACYHADALFMDPVFGKLRRDEVCAMWRMLLGRAQDIRVNFEVLHADEHSGSARWEARYTFSKTGRQVLNRIEAQFGFHEGLILAHRDRFDFWKWTRMALGFKGLLLGWSPLVQNAVRREARKSLDAFMAKEKA